MRLTAGHGSAVAVVDGRVHVAVSSSGAGVAQAFDADTGELLWTSDRIRFGRPTSVLSSAVVYDGIQLLTTKGEDSDTQAAPGYALLDAATGKTLASDTFLPADDRAEGYAGGGVWSTAAVDEVSGYAYMGTSSPKQQLREHDRDNAILKIDLDRDRATFGKIVGSYRGTPDGLVAGVDQNPACQALGPHNLPPNAVVIGPYFAPHCGRLDVDFGASPVLFHDSNGRALVGELQKSGVFHAVDRDTMEGVWQATLDLPAFFGNAASAAYDGERIYVSVNVASTIALDPDDGSEVWRRPHNEIASVYQPATVANGVLYVGHGDGLLGYHSESGVPILVRHIPSDTGGSTCGGQGVMGGNAGGIAVAHHTVIVNCDGTLVAYRLGTPS